MLFKRFLLSGNIARVIQSRLVSTVNINVNSLSSIQIKAKDLHEKSDDFVKLTFLDKENKEVDASQVPSLQVTSTTDDFKMNCTEPMQLTAVVEIPLGSSPESQINVSAGSSSVHVENLQTKSVEIKVSSGDVSFKNMKGKVVRAETGAGNILTSSTLLGQTVQLISKSGMVNIAKSQGDNLEVEAASIDIGSCYNNMSKLSSTRDAMLKNIHGCAEIKASGESLRLRGMTGNIKANIDTNVVEIQLSVMNNHNEITTNNPDANIILGLSDDILKSTQIRILSSCPIENSIEDLMVISNKKKSFEVSRYNTKAKNFLNFTVKKGKSLELNEMSWVDFFKSVNLKAMI